MSRKKWILIGVACAAAIIGFAVASLVPSDRAGTSSHSGSFVAIYLPILVAIIVSARARRKHQEAKRDG